MTVTSCSNIYATAIGGDTDNNILVTSGTFSETDSTTTEDSVIADTTDYNWTWGSLSTTTETAYSAIAASSDSIYIYAASTNSTIGVSSDGGNSWTTASGPGTADWSDISCSSNGQYITVVSFAGDIWTSTDFGATWNSDILIEQDTLISVAVSDDGATVFLGGNNGAYLSIDSGGGYTEVPTSDYINSSLTYGFKVAGSSDGSVLIAASAFGGILSSNDTGETWAFFDSNTTFSSVKYANGIVYAASTEDGLYSSTDNGATWTMFDAAPQEEEWKTIAVSSDGTFIAAAASFELISVSDDGRLLFPRPLLPRLAHSLTSPFTSLSPFSLLQLAPRGAPLARAICGRTSSSCRAARCCSPPQRARPRSTRLSTRTRRPLPPLCVDQRRAAARRAAARRAAARRAAAAAARRAAARRAAASKQPFYANCKKCTHRSDQRAKL